MGAFFDNMAFIHDHNLIGITNGGQPMRNHKGRAPLRQAR